MNELNTIKPQNLQQEQAMLPQPVTFT